MRCLRNRGRRAGRSKSPPSLGDSGRGPCAGRDGTPGRRSLPRPDPALRGGAAGSRAGRNRLSGLRQVPSPRALQRQARRAVGTAAQAPRPTSLDSCNPAEGLGTRKKKKNKSCRGSPDLRIEIGALGKEGAAQLAPFRKTFSLELPL